MKRNDIVLIAILLVVALSALFAVRVLQDGTRFDDGTAVVYHKGRLVLSIALVDGSEELHDDDVFVATDIENVNELLAIHFDGREISAEEAGEGRFYIVPGNNGPVTIRYRDHMVEVIDETSPRNICQHQGQTNSPFKPLTCLPNDVVIRILRPGEESDGSIR